MTTSTTGPAPTGKRFPLFLRLPRLTAFRAAGALLGLSVAHGLVAQPAAPAAGALQQADPSAALFALGMKLEGAATCSNAKCHGAPAEAKGAGGDYVNPSYTLWNAEGTADAPADPHRNAFKTLRKPASAEMAKKLGLGNPVQAAACLACHAISPPEPVRGQAFQVAEGVTCNGCHGPSGPGGPVAAYKGWNEAHKEKGWTDKQRTQFAGKHDALLKQTGLYDTKPLVPRSQQCVSCHLSINPKMVAAGHPQPTFEMNWYSAIYGNRHWTDPTDKYFASRLWAAGQAAALESAMRQLAERADPKSGATQAEVTTAYNQAYAHYAVFAPLFSAGGVAGDINTVAAQLTAASKVLNDSTKRADLGKAATAGAEAAVKLNAAVENWQPTKDQAMKVLAAVINNKVLPGLGGFGIEQQRSGIFAIYSGYAGSADGAGDAEAAGNVDLIGQKLFIGADGAPTDPFKVPAAQHTAAVNEIKAKLKL